MSAVQTQREADEAQIRQQVARIADGIRAKDLESLRPIYATDIVVTFCFRKLDGAWQIVHDQASVPFDVLSGRGVADLQP
jgi:ketosteroid isomerase-like protein